VITVFQKIFKTVTFGCRKLGMVSLKSRILGYIVCLHVFEKK